MNTYSKPWTDQEILGDDQKVMGIFCVLLPLVSDIINEGICGILCMWTYIAPKYNYQITNIISVRMRHSIDNY